MSKKEVELEFRTKQLERKVKGMQQRMEVVNAKFDQITSKQERRIRDLEIKNAVQVEKIPQRKVAEIYELSPGRVSQIVRNAS
ncbi:hypothetical protein PJ912_16535 [Pectobacterium colocasium]|uniref:Uncharacterized protein n=1 Tax=Pectobacterium polonicum TaxID=2485124 RepID=A0AAE9NTN7_9GAMM|nr:MULTISPECIES: hypothetical protein [Pectobacterium]WED67888.1 hypothetical protein PJ912_16535 [Pectobacterium colocasium]UUE35789.1 hypothetical protein L0Y26_19395 [Pectobacterium aroidearum]UUE40164.1 hypothetical protein L0Y25_19400 [Pectobacterium aroidearum]UUE44493.1 hypothetical protein L0Y28_18525 [Pectobacterium aroidearum]UUE48713.1 hypothetical protein L0Y23_18405 [Pectobacterium aroidearum]